MYSCGFRDINTLLGLDFALAQGASGAQEAPAFALPGDEPKYAPDRPADVRHVDIDVTLDFQKHTVTGTVTTAFSALFDPLREVVFDAAELTIENVTLDEDDTPLHYWIDGEKLHVALGREYHFGHEFQVRVRYSAQPRIGLVFVEPVEGNPDLPVQAWTQGETEYHHFWLPVHDFPNDRATTSLRATVPEGFFVLSNGKSEGVTSNGDGTATHAWRCDQPFPAYLITLVAGEFVEIKDQWRTVPVNYYVRAGREEDGRRMMGKTPAMIDFFSQRFGVDYPWVKYGQIVAELFLGAMENASATTHTYRLLADKRASLDFTPEPVVAHELVHQWHGDMLAVRDWSHTWLKESFATYFESVWTQHDRGEDEFRAELHANLQAYLAADKRGRRPIVYNVYRKNANELFDRHVYEKGSLVLHMLRYVLGEDAFWRGLQHYTRSHKWREVITADFERALEEATGRSLARFFEQWVYKTGHPEFTVTYSWDDEHKLAKLKVSQKQKTSDTTPIFATPVDIGFFVPDTDATPGKEPPAHLQTFRVEVGEAEQTFYFPLARRPLSVRFDQGAWLIKTLEFERPADMLRYQLRHDPDMEGRIEAAEALGKLPDSENVAALRQAMLDEPFWAVRVAIASALGGMKSEPALDALLDGLAAIDEPKARRGIVSALGQFRAPEYEALAGRAAQALAPIVEHGDPSYYVEAAAASALGRTRTAAAFDLLVAKAETPSWNEIIRGGVFAGLGELGEARSADVLIAWLRDRSRPMDARMMAAAGLRVLAETRRIDPGETQTRVIEALIAALDDPWEMTQSAAIQALAAWNDARAIAPLQRFVAQSPDERRVRQAREALLRLQKGHSENEELRQLRSDLEELRAANSELRQRIQSLEATHQRE